MILRDEKATVMGDETKSGMTCRKCGSSDQVIRQRWEADCSGPTIFHDDHICLGCGLIVNGCGCRIGDKSLKEYRKKYGHIVSRGNAVFRKLLNAALREAKAGLAEGGIPIGSVLATTGGRILARGRNMRVQDGNPMAHAEIACMTALGRQRDFNGLILASTLMPCALCAGAAIQFGIGTVVVGENRTFEGEGDLLESRGVKAENMDDDRCVRIMDEFVRENPDLWGEDIGEKTNKRGRKACANCVSCDK